MGACGKEKHSYGETGTREHMDLIRRIFRATKHKTNLRRIGGP